jgi:hypothetical protein
MTPRQVALVQESWKQLQPIAEQGLGVRFTQEAEDAWRAAYRALAATMKQTTREASRCK